MMFLLFILALMVLPLVLALAVVWWLSGKVTRRIGWRLLSLAIVPVVAFWDLVPTRHAFDWLCERQGGLQIRKVVHDVPGLAVFRLPKNCVGSCASFLAELGYSFVEGTPSENMDGSIEIFRYWLAPRGDASCQSFPESKNPRTNVLKTRLADNCIAREAIPAFTVDYAYSLRARRNPNIIWPLEIRQVSRQVFDLRTKEILAEINRYENYTGWFVRHFMSFTPYPAETCPVHVPNFIGIPSEYDREGQIRNVLVPPQRGTE